MPTGPASQVAPQPTLALRPAAVVQATVSDVMLTLPYDQDFGRAERFGELWSKAFGQVSLLPSAIASSPQQCKQHIHYFNLLLVKQTPNPNNTSWSAQQVLSLVPNRET